MDWLNVFKVMYRSISRLEYEDYMKYFSRTSFTYEEFEMTTPYVTEFRCLSYISIQLKNYDVTALKFKEDNIMIYQSNNPEMILCNGMKGLLKYIKDNA